MIILGMEMGFSQVYVEEPTPHYVNDEYGFQISMAQQGFGIGAFYNKMITSHNYLGLSLAFYKIRDSKEFEFYYYGYYYVQNKINNLFIFPLQFQYKRLFLTDAFADDLRPNLVLTAGGIFGMNFPNRNGFPSDDPNLNRSLRNEYQLGLSWGIGFALDIPTNKKIFLTIKPTYQWVYFSSTIAQQQWHNYYEIRLEFGTRK